MKLFDLENPIIRDNLSKLLKDKTTRNNIIFASSSYDEVCFGFKPYDEITIESMYCIDFQSRVHKSAEDKKKRTKKNAEVFTSAAICCEMNNYCDDFWFGKKNIFNLLKDGSWNSTNEPISFPIGNKDKTWKKYVELKKIEVACGECPFVVSRYDVTTGKMIPISERVGFLDRKLRVINENVNDETEWVYWVIRAYESSYGYEYQGDNLFIGRINLFLTFLEYFEDKWHKEPSEEVLNEIINRIVWNFFQMDGLNFYRPLSNVVFPNEVVPCYNPETEEMEVKPIIVKPKLFNWRGDRSVPFLSLVNGEAKGKLKMSFDFAIGNPPYQMTRGGTKNVDIWPNFVFDSIKVSKYSVMIHPGRWVVPKKYMKSTQEELINNGLEMFNYYPRSSKIFKGVDVDGGITVTCFNIKHENNDIVYFNEGEFKGTYEVNKIFFSNDYEEEVYKKLNATLFNGKSIFNRIYGNSGSLGGGEYGYKKSLHIEYLKKEKSGMKNPLKIWANSGYGKSSHFDWYYIDKDVLNDIPIEILKTRKVMLDKKGHSCANGRGNIINNIPKIVDSDAIASGDVFFVLPQIDNDYHLELIKSYFMTKTIRYLMSVIQKDLYVRGFEIVPDYVLFEKKLNGSLFSDSWFYAEFEFSPELVSEIEKRISEKKE